MTQILLKKNFHCINNLWGKYFLNNILSKPYWKQTMTFKVDVEDGL